jgi:MarR family transcriptional regulator, transcriptional regulator for hemolysin
MTKPSPHNAIALMRESARLYTKIFGKRFRELHLTAEEARTLAYLSIGETMSQRRLADLMHVQPIVLSRLIDRLEAASWAERRPSPSDRRVNEIHLTAKGRAGARKIRAINDNLADRLTAELAPEDLPALVRGLQVIRAALEEIR